MNLVQSLDIRDYDPFRVSLCNASNVYYNRPYHFETTSPKNSHLYAALTSAPILEDAFIRYTQSQCNGQQFEMQVARFPTPPITPPKNEFESHVDLREPSPSSRSTFPKGLASHHQFQRNYSVIMKVDQKHRRRQSLADSLSHINIGAQVDSLKVESDDTIDVDMASQDNTSNDSGSLLYTDNVCNWMDCRMYFNSLESLAAHVTQAHAVPDKQDGLYYCHWMGCQRQNRGFNARYKMLVHVRTHTKEKPHHCHLCEKSFSRAENLKIHLRSHSGEKPYVCGFEGCNKAYSNSSDRFKHTRTHNEQKPYVCKIEGCNKRYTDPSSLRKHVKTFKHGVQLISENVLISSNNNNATIKEIEKTYCESDAGTVFSETRNFKSFTLLPSHPPHLSLAHCSVQPFKQASLETYCLRTSSNDKPLDLRINRP